MSTRLPPELHSEIFQYSDHDSILALAAVSRLLNTLANRTLYKHVEFDGETPASTVRLFLDRVSRRQGLASLVVRLELDWNRSSGRTEATSAIANLMGLTLPKMTALAYLSAAPVLDIFTWVFDDMTMPVLRQLHLYQRSHGGISPGFLDRHPGLTHLTLYPEARPPRNARQLSASELGRLPNLVNLHVSHLSTLEQVLQRTPPTTLRRLDITMGNLVDLQLEALNRLLVGQLSTLQQLNLWSSFSSTPWADLATLEALPTVTRFGICACRHPSSGIPLPREDGAAERLARVFPALERLELLCSWRSHWQQRDEMERACEDLCAWTASSFAALRCIAVLGRIAYVRALPGEPFMRASAQEVAEIDWSIVRSPQQ